MFAAFAFPSYHPRGGWMDLIGVYATQEAAMEAVDNRPEALENWHVVDIASKTIVKSGKTRA